MLVPTSIWDRCQKCGPTRSVVSGEVLVITGTYQPGCISRKVEFVFSVGVPLGYFSADFFLLFRCGSISNSKMVGRFWLGVSQPPSQRLRKFAISILLPRQVYRRVLNKVLVPDISMGEVSGFGVLEEVQYRQFNAIVLQQPSKALGDRFT